MRTRYSAKSLRRTGLMVGMGAVIAGGLHAQDTPTLPSLDRMGRWSGLAAANMARWSGTRQATPNWNQPDFDAGKWTRAIAVEGTTYPAAVVDDAGVRYPIPEQVQYAFRPFWLPATSKSKRERNPSSLNNDRADTAPVWFRQDFDFTEAYAGCATYVSQEVATTLYVNGVKVAGSNGNGGHVQKEFRIDSLLHRGRNTVAIEAQQTQQTPIPLTVRTDIHERFPVRADEPMAWSCSPSAGPNWSLPDYRPSASDAWTSAVMATFSPDFARKGEVASSPIWHIGDSSRQGVTYFRMPLDIAGMPNFGDCEIQADSGWELWVNGELAGVNKGDHTPNPTPVTSVQIGRFLHPGKNVIGVETYNHGRSGTLSILPHVKISF